MPNFFIGSRARTENDGMTGGGFRRLPKAILCGALRNAGCRGRLVGTIDARYRSLGSVGWRVRTAVIPGAGKSGAPIVLFCMDSCEAPVF